MSSDFPDREIDETRQLPSVGAAGGAPPNMTAPIYMPPGPPSGRRFLVLLLVLLLGAGGGFAVSQIVGQHKSEKIPDSQLVMYENASTSFPIAKAAFTNSTFVSASSKCDRELLKRYLRADQRRFKAWIDLQQISESEFDSFVNRLQTQILTKATPVTNHGCFPEGAGECPFAIQSVLGPGTPVWFDPQQHRIVAKCMCSNPLNDPQCPPNCEDIPTPTPTEPPTEPPTEQPTLPPTEAPTPTPTASPTAPPTSSPSPTQSPTVRQTAIP